jgi:hypothetical protein
MSEHLLPVYPTPDEFAAAAKFVIAKIRGDTSVSNAHAAHCGWIVAGFIQGTILPCDHPDDQPHPMQAKECPEKCGDPEALAKCLEKCCPNGQPIAMQAAAGFDWSSLINVLLPLILSWLQPKPKV